MTRLEETDWDRAVTQRAFREGYLDETPDRDDEEVDEDEDEQS